MKSIKDYACILTAVLVLFSAVSLFSCGQGNGEVSGTGETSASVVVSSGPEFAEADYGGRDFTVYMRTSTLIHYAGIYIFCPENATDLVNEQTAARNAMVEEKYGVNLRFIENDEPSSTVRTDVAGGFIPYDLVLEGRYAFQSLAADGLLRNFLDLDIDYTTEWWDANARRIYGYKNRLFVMPNDISVSNLAGVRFLWFNKDVLNNFHLSLPYEYVARNEWTLDNFIEMVKGVSAPGAEGHIGTYGLAYGGETRDFMLTGLGAFEVEVDENDDLVCRIGTDYAEKTQDYFDKIRAVGEDPNYCIDYSTARELDYRNSRRYSDMFTHTRALFSQGHFLFIETSMGAALRDFEETPGGVGVVMNPKYSADQPDYYHKVDRNALIWAMPADPNADTGMLKNILDYWAWASHRTVMEAYYELTLKTKRASDPVMAEMLDTVKGSVRYYITDIFKADVGSFITQAYTTSVKNAWRTYAKQIPNAFAELQETIERIE